MALVECFDPASSRCAIEPACGLRSVLNEALAAFHQLARTEGILPALESSHALAQAVKLARELPRDGIVLCNLSGRGDKDVHTIAARDGLSI